MVPFHNMVVIMIHGGFPSDSVTVVSQVTHSGLKKKLVNHELFTSSKEACVTTEQR
jgi:hypothetical protein